MWALAWLSLLPAVTAVAAAFVGSHHARLPAVGPRAAAGTRRWVMCDESGDLGDAGQAPLLLAEWGTDDKVRAGRA
jgi:hypothetical protein